MFDNSQWAVMGNWVDAIVSDFIWASSVTSSMQKHCDQMQQSIAATNHKNKRLVTTLQQNLATAQSQLEAGMFTII